MLTPTDIHILVGLLTKVTVPEDVDVELGEFVFDKAAEIEREVDVTVKHKNLNGIITAFLGIEVKDHSRPLDVAEIEQLCLKFNDMPEVTHRAIVSASGYTPAAIKKANSHNVELFKLIPWEDTSIGFDQAFIPDDELISEITGSWIQLPTIAFHVAPEYESILKEANLSELKIFRSDGSPIPGIITGADLYLLIANHTAKEHTKSIAGTLKSKEENTIVKRIIEPIDSVCLEHNGLLIPVIDFRVIGSRKYTANKRKTIYKILLRNHETMPHVGCAIAEMNDGTLLGVTANNETKKMDFIWISLTDRQKKKIFQKRL